jgi:hypothetical protein
MKLILGFPDIARQYAHYVSPEEKPERAEAKFAAAAFNVATAASIAAVALALFSHSIPLFALAACAYSIRGAITKFITWENNAEPDIQILEFVCWMSPVAFSDPSGEGSAYAGGGPEQYGTREQ